MCDSYDTTLILWPATPLPASVADQLRRIGVELADPQSDPGCLTAKRTQDGQLVLEISREQLHGLTDLEAVLASLRLAGVSYVAWEAKKSDVAGTGRSYDPDTDIPVEREFTVMPDGEPVLTASDLDAFEHYGTAEALLDAIRAWLRLPLPQDLSEVDGFTIVVEAEDDEDEAQMPALRALGQAVRQERERAGLTVVALATASGIQCSELGELEAGRLDAEFDLLLALAQALGIRSSALFIRAEALTAAAERA